MTSWRRIPRPLWAALLFLFLGGPTPGAVGSCDADPDGFADLQAYCQQREELVCVRRSLRKEITIGEREECRRRAIALCAQRTWAPDCRPTERQARACINALFARDTLYTPEDELEECNTEALCNVRLTPQAEPTDGGMP
ncbi:MAG: hypothetical protein PVI30_06575 [Myxococcales bacterium]